MTKIELEQKIRQHPFCNGLGNEWVHYMAGCAEERQYACDEYLMRFQQPAEEFHLLLQGQTVLINQLPGRKMNPFETITAPNVVGWSWLVAPYRWHFDVRAKTDIKSICVHTMCLHGKMQSDTDFGFEIYKRFIQIIVDRLQASRLQAMDIYAKPEEGPGL